MRLKKLRYVLITLVLTFSGSACEKKAGDKLPNIILISVDDMGYSDLGCYGSEINTPNIDSLATGGVRFRSFYNTAKCFPSRAALVTGVYAQDCGYHETFRNPISNAVTIGEVLKTKGYQTYWSGKHHSTENPFFRGFDHYYGLLDGAANHFNPGKQREGEPKPAQKKNNRRWVIDNQVFQPYDFPEGFYSTDAFTDYGIRYLEESKKNNAPFFLYLAYTAPHDPLMAWPEDIAKYKGKYDSGYQVVRKRRFEKQQAIGLFGEGYQLSEAGYTPWDELSELQRIEEASKMEVYAAMIDRLDQNIGRLLETLSSLEYDDNTIIFFVSDNGASREMVELDDDDEEAPIGSMSRWVSLGQSWANVSNTPFRYYKNDSYEGGINTPMIAYWPRRFSGGSFNDFPGHIMDFMATFVELSGAEYPSENNGEEITPMRGTSLLPVLTGENLERDVPLYWEWHGGQAIRQGAWKTVRLSNDLPWELYQIVEDPTERTNLADTHPMKVRALDSLYQIWYGKYYK